MNDIASSASGAGDHMHSFEDAHMNYEDALGICVAALAIKIFLITMCTVSTAVAPTCLTTQRLC